MNSNILDYIILALIFAVVIHIFIRTFGSVCSKTENMEESTQNISEEIKHANIEESTQNISEEIKHDNIVDDKSLFDSMKQEVRSENASEKNDMIENKNDRYVREFVLGGRTICPKKFTQEEIKEYKTNFFGFNDKINNSSSAGVDMVDKINESNNYEGKKISDIFNELTQNKEKECGNPKCIIPPQIDINHHTGSYKETGHFGKIFSRYHWKYEDDNVNNGGKFYDNIEASDYGMESEMALTD